MKKLFALIPLAIMLVATLPVQATGVSVVALPNPIGIPEIILVAALLGFALWKRGWIRIILCLGIITWGIFFMAYDAKVAAPLLGVGVVLFILGVMTQIRNVKHEASE